MSASTFICGVCQRLKTLGSFSDDGTVFICSGCDADAKQFLEIQESIWGSGETSQRGAVSSGVSEEPLMASSLVGWWRIEAMEVWDQDAIDLVGPGFIEMRADGHGRLSFIAVQGDIDCRFGVVDGVDGVDAVEFSWEGDDDGTPVSGRGSARLSADGKLEGRVFFHLGDDSWFSARRADAAEFK